MAPAGTSPGDRQILLVEDNPGDVRLLREAFATSCQQAGLTAVGSGEDALAYLRREGRFEHVTTPDLIVLDLNLPGLSGHETLAAIKNDPDLQHIPVVILSSSGAEDDIRRCYDAQANGYILKPQGFDRYVETADGLAQYYAPAGEEP